MNKHTPGPWRFYTEPQPNGCPIVGNDKGLMVAMLAHSINYPEQFGEAMANAQLIAAAPELLEALQELNNYVTQEQMATDGAVVYSTTQVNRIAFIARAAIAKAKGEVK